MTPVVSSGSAVAAAAAVSVRANALAERLEEGARRLATLGASLTAAQWQLRLPHDGRKVGVVIHHVASMYHPVRHRHHHLARIPRALQL